MTMSSGKGGIWIPRHTYRENGGRDWGDASMSQGRPEMAVNWQQLGEEHGADSPSQASEETEHANTPILDFWLPDCDTIHFLCLSHLGCCPADLGS